MLRSTLALVLSALLLPAFAQEVSDVSISGLSANADRGTTPNVTVGFNLADTDSETGTFDVTISIGDGLGFAGGASSPTIGSLSGNTSGSSLITWSVTLTGADVDGNYSITVPVTVVGTGGASATSMTAAFDNLSGVTTDGTTSDTDTVNTTDLTLNLNAPGSTTIGVDSTYVVELNSSGARNSEGVVVTVSLPTGYTFVSGQCGATAGAGSTVVLTPSGTISGDRDCDVMLRPVIVAPADYTVTAEVTDNDAPDLDSIPGNGVGNGEDDQDSETVAPSSVDLTVTLDVSPSQANIGDCVTFTTQVENNGPDNAEGVDITLALPGGYTATNCSGPGGAATTFTDQDINNGDTATFRTDAEVTAGDGGADVSEFTATASITGSDTGLVNTGDDSDTDAITNFIDLSLDLIPGTAGLNPLEGASETVTVQVTADPESQRAAPNVAVCVAVPAGLTLTNAGGADTNEQGCDVFWRAGTIATSSSDSIDLTLTVEGTGPYNISAEIFDDATGGAIAPDRDSVAGNLSGTEDDADQIIYTPIEVADLSLSLVVSDSLPNIGETPTFTLTLINSGPSGHTGGIDVRYTVPDGYSLDSFNPSRGTITNTDPVLQWDVSNIPSGGSETLQVVAEVLSGSDYRHTAEITADSLADSDSTPNNGVESEDDFAAITASPAAPDLVVTAETTPATAVGGSNLTYSFRIANTTAVNAPGVLVSDVYPAFTTIPSAGFDSGDVTWQCEAFNGACCNANSANCGTTPNPTTPLATALTDVAMDLAPLSSVVITISGDLDPRSTGALSNSVTAEVAAGTFEQDTSNNTNIDTLTGASAVSEADLSISKVSNTLSGSGPFSIDYEIRVTNNGPSFVAGATVTDLLDGSDPVDGPFFDVASATWSCTLELDQGDSACPMPGTGALNAVSVSLDPGASAVFALSVDTLVTSGSVTNTASVAAPVGVTDAIGSNNNATERVVLSGASDLTITQQGPTGSVVAGTDLTYTLQIFNNGPDFAPAASVTDVLPSAIANVTWECSAVTPVPGDLTRVESVIRAADLVQPEGLVFSPDGSHVYVASRGTDSVLSYRRETIPSFNFGELSFLEVETDGVDDGGDFGGTVADMDDPVRLAISPDGRFVYVAARASGAVVWFQRDTLPASANFGRLTYSGSLADPSLAGAADLVVSADGEHIYVASADQPGVVWLDRDPGNGSVTVPPGGTNVYDHAASAGGEISSPTSLALSPDGATLLVGALNADSENTLRVLTRQTDNGAVDYGALTQVGYEDGSSVDDVVITPDGGFVYVTRFADDQIGRYSLGMGGALTGGTNLSETDMTLAAGSLAGIKSLAVSGDGEHVAAGAQTANTVSYLRINPVTGALLAQDGSQLADGADGNNLLAGPLFLVFSPDQRHLLTSAAVDNAVNVFDRRAPDPILTFIEFEQDGLAGEPAQPQTAGLIGPAAVVVSPDGNHVYTGSVGGNGSISAFTRNAAAGITVDTRGQNLRFIETYTGGTNGIEGLEGLADLTFDSTGTYLYAASESDNAVAVFQRNSVDGTLTFVEAQFDGVNGFDGLAGAGAVAVDPDDNYLYVAARFEAAVGIFSIDGGTGALTYVSKISNADAGVSGLEGASNVAVAPDSGAEPGQVIVTSAVDNALVVFDRDRTSGLLTFNASYGVGVGERPLGLAVSNSGEHVYVAAANTSSVSVFRRDADDASATYGALSFQAAYIDGSDGIENLGGARSIAVSLDGTRAYVAAETDQALSVFSINAESSSSSFGALTFVEARIDNQNGVEGLDQIYDVAVSRDGSNVYTVGLDDNAVSAFRLGEGSRCPAGGSGNLSGVSVDIAPAGTLTFFISGQARSSATTGSLVNTATVTVPDGFEDPVDNDGSMDGSESVTVVTPLAAEADVFISKTDNRISNVAGESTSYTITIGNAGPSDAIHNAPGVVEVSDLLDGSDTPGDATDDDRFVLGETSWSCTAIGSGSLTLTDLEQGIDGLVGVSAVAVAPAFDTLGPVVYAASVLDDSLLAFNLDTDTGELTFDQRVTNGDTLGLTVSALGGARDVAVSDDGRYIYVVSQVSDAISVYQASDAGGNLALTLLQEITISTVATLDQPVALTLSPDPAQAQVYVAAAKSDSVLQFSRSSGNGQLSFVQSYSNGAGPSDVLALEDHVYVAATNSSAVTYFSRDAGTGNLTVAGSLVDDADTLLSAPVALAASPNGRVIFVASSDDNAITSLTRDLASGALTVFDELSQADADVTQLLAPSALAVSADGFHLYAGAAGSGAINIVSLGSDGELVLNSVITNVGDTGGLGGISGLALSSDSTRLFSAAQTDNAVGAFARLADSSCPVSGTGNINAVPVNVAAGGQIVFTLNTEVSATATGDLRNTATIDAAIDADGVDCGDFSDPADDNNNCATDSNDLNPEADLSIIKFDQFIEFDGLAGAAALAATPDGAYLYVAGAGEQSIAVFERNLTPPVGVDDPVLGEPVFRSFVRNGVNGVSGLNGVSDLKISSDGEFLYASAALDSALTVFAIDGADGSLSQVADVRNNGTVAGLSGAAALVLTPDNEHLYVAGPNTGTLAAFTRDDMSGQVTFLQLLQNGIDGVTGLARPAGLAAAANGSQLYVTSSLDNALVVFDRETDDQVTGFGELTYRQTLISGVGGVTSLVAPAQVVAEPGGDHLYVAAAGSNAVVAFEIPATLGDLSFIGAVESSTSVRLDGVTSLALAPAVGGAGPIAQVYAGAPDGDTIAVLDRNTISGVLTAVSDISEGDDTALPTVSVAGLIDVAGLLVAGSAEQLYAVSPATGSVTALARASGGELSYLLTQSDGGGGAAPGSVVSYTIEVSNFGPSDVAEARVTDLFPEQFSDITWVCEATDTSLADPAECQASGEGSLESEAVILPAGTAVRFIASATLRPDATGRVTNTASVAAVSALDPNPTNNVAVDSDTVLSPAVDLMVTNSNGLSALNPGQDVTYNFGITNAGPSNAAAVTVSHVLPERLAFSNWSCVATPVPGRLTPLVDMAPDGIDTVRELVISADGSSVYAVGLEAGSGALSIYRRDNRDGSLSAFGVPIENGDNLSGNTVGGLAGAAALALSPDDRHLYVAGAGDDAVAIFSRNTTTGELSFVGRILDGVAGVNGLGGAIDVLVSADGTKVYVAGQADNAVAVFTRNTTDGTLSFQEAATDAALGGLSAPSKLAADPGDAFVYVLSAAGNRITRLERNLTGGLINPVVLENNQLAESVLEEPTDLQFAADGELAYVTSATSNALARFRVDGATGVLSFDQAWQAGDPGFDGLDGPQGVALSSSGQEIYVISAATPSISLLSLIDGTLTQTQFLASGLPGNLRGIVLAPGERHIYLEADVLEGFDVNAGSRCATSGSGDINDLVSLSSGGSVTYTLAARVSPAATGSVTSVVEASAGSGVVELLPADNQGVDTDSITPQTGGVVVGLTRSNVGRAAPEPVAGITSRFDVTLDNTAISDLLGAELTLALPLYPADPNGLDPATLEIAECTQADPLVADEQISDAALDGVVDAVFSADGNYAYVLAAGRLLTYRVTVGGLVPDGTLSDGDSSGALTVAGLAGASALGINETVDDLYVLAAADNQLLAFTRDSADGSVTLRQVVTNGQNSVTSLLNPQSVVASPDGANVYVAAPGADAIVQLGRAGDGTLSFVERVRDGFGTIAPDSNVIRAVSALTLSGDGSLLLAAGTGSNALATFAVAGSDGRLTYLSKLTDVDEPALTAPRDVRLSRNASSAYALLDDGIVVARVDAETGVMTPIQVLASEVDGLPEFGQLAAFDLTTDNSKLLAVSQQTAAVILLHRDFDTGLLRYGGQTQSMAAPLDDVSSLVISRNDADVLLTHPQAPQLSSWQLGGFSQCPTLTTGEAILSQSVDLAGGAQLTLAIEGLLHPRARGRLDSLAQVTTGATVLGQATLATAADDISVEHDLALTATVLTADPVAGEGIELSLEVSNAGPSAALDASLTADLTGGVSNIVYTCALVGEGSCGGGSGPLTGVLLTVDPLAVATYSVSGDLAASLLGPLNLSGSVAAETGATDPAPGNNTFADSPTVTRVSDLSATIQVLGQPWLPGTPVSYRIRLENSGPSDADDNPFTATLAAALTDATIACSTLTAPMCPTDGTVFDGSVNLPAGTEATLEVTGDLPPSVISSAVQLAASIDPDVDSTDPDLANNNDEAEPNIVRTGAISVSIEDNRDPYDPLGSGPGIEYIATLTNAGPSVADVAARFRIPEEFVVGPGPCLLDVADPGNLDVYECRVDRPFIGTQTVSILLRPAPGVFTGTYNVGLEQISDAVDTTSGDDTDVEQTTLASGTDLVVSQTVDVTNLLPGAPFVFTVTVVNEGSTRAQSVDVAGVIDEALVDQLAWTCVASGVGRCDAAGTGPLQLSGVIPPGDRFVIEFTGELASTVDVNAVDWLDHEVTAVVNDATGDIYTPNNTSLIQVPVDDVVFSDSFEETP
ncbi:MAG: beta-propeller fold lactonase family protein [Pseudomonadota bacterium]